MAQKLAVSFKGGLAKGLGSLGMIRYMQEENIVPYIYAGASSGAMLAAGFAIGMNWKELQHMMEQFRFRSIVSISSLFRNGCLVPYERLRKVFEESTAGYIKPNVRIEELDKKLVIFATDPINNERVFIRSGNLIDAVLASSGYPVIFPNLTINRQFVVDGDLSNSYSANQLRKYGADYVVGISTAPEKPSVRSLRRNFLSKIIEVQYILGAQVSRFNNQIDPVDLEIKYDASGHSYFDFRINALIQRAYRATREHEDLLQKFINEEALEAQVRALKPAQKK